jgi:hypothetical protein
MSVITPSVVENQTLVLSGTGAPSVKETYAVIWLHLDGVAVTTIGEALRETTGSSKTTAVLCSVPLNEARTVAVEL